MKRVLALLALAASGSALAAPADSGIERDFPPGSIQTREQAAAATQAAGAHAREIEQRFKKELERCASVVLVTRCQGNARSRRDADQRAVENVRREARATVRRLDAEARATVRATEAARRAAAAPATGKRAAESRDAFDAREKAAARIPKAPVAQALTPAGPAQQRSAAERAENVKRLQDKQRTAAEYAKAKSAERAENERRREKRKQEKLDEERKRAAARRTQ